MVQLLVTLRKRVQKVLLLLTQSIIFQARKLWIENRYQNNPLQQGRAVAPVLTRSSWIRYLSNLRRENITDTSFIVVRHPFERLVSAYRDKIERSHAKNYLTDWYYKQYGQKIVKKYRSQAINLFGPQFFRWVFFSKNYYSLPFFPCMHIKMQVMSLTVTILVMLPLMNNSKS